jgi:hypothetical protein
MSKDIVMYQLDTPYSSQILFLNSENSVFKNIDGEGSYQYDFQTPIQLPTNCQMLISITDAQMPNIIPNVTSSNNTISFSIPTFSKLFTITIREDDGITDRVYNVQEWLAVVNEKITYEAVSQFSLYGGFNTSTSKITWYCNYPFQILSNVEYPTTCFDLIGFKKNRFNEVVYESEGVLLSSVLNPSYHITMPSCVNFSGTRFIFVKFKNISVNNLNSRGVTDQAVVRIDNNAPFGFMIFYRPIEVHRFIINRQTINNISFTLTDTQGKELNIFSNDAQITIKLEYMYKPNIRSMEEGTINYELRKLSKVLTDKPSIAGSYNPETNEFIRE